MKNVKYGTLEKYFTKKDEQFIIDDEIKKKVQFSFYDLLDKKRPFTLWNIPFRYFTYADYPAQDFENKQAKQEIFDEYHGNSAGF